MAWALVFRSNTGTSCLGGSVRGVLKTPYLKPVDHGSYRDLEPWQLQLSAGAISTEAFWTLSGLCSALSGSPAPRLVWGGSLGTWDVQDSEPRNQDGLLGLKGPLIDPYLWPNVEL